MKRIIAYFKDLLSTLHEIRDELVKIKYELRVLNHNCNRWFSTHNTFDYKRGSL